MSDDAKRVSKEEFQQGARTVNLTERKAKDSLSPDSDALRCYTAQTFSRRLQVFMLNYRTMVTTDYALTDE